MNVAGNKSLFLIRCVRRDKTSPTFLQALQLGKKKKMVYKAVEVLTGTGRLAIDTNLKDILIPPNNQPIPQYYGGREITFLPMNDGRVNANWTDYNNVARATQAFAYVFFNKNNHGSPFAEVEDNDIGKYILAAGACSTCGLGTEVQSQADRHETDNH